MQRPERPVGSPVVGSMRASLRLRRKRLSIELGSYQDPAVEIGNTLSVKPPATTEEEEGNWSVVATAMAGAAAEEVNAFEENALTLTPHARPTFNPAWKLRTDKRCNIVQTLC